VAVEGRDPVAVTEDRSQENLRRQHRVVCQENAIDSFAPKPVSEAENVPPKGFGFEPV
jgi:hypothetical protein